MARIVALPALLLIAAALSGCSGVGWADELSQTREITMWVEQMDWEIHPGVTTTVWAFCAEGDGVEPVWDGPCGVPGPTIHVDEGDTIILHFRNDHSIPHTVHFHGWHPYEMDMNGNGALGDAMVADPGETETITWVAEPAGSFIYHCHFDTPTHMEMGMYGAFIVHEKGAEHPDVEQVMILDEWQIRDEPSWSGNMPDYNFFTINGKSFPLTQPIIAEPGQSVRLHMINAGYRFHAMHLHGYTPDSYEGASGPDWARRTDVREIAPGQTVVLDLVADREGIWLFHDHVVPSVSAASSGEGGFGAYPRGMLTAMVVGQQYLDQILEIVPVLLGAAANDVVAPEAAHEGHDHGHEHGSHSHEPADPEPEVDAAPEVVSNMKDFKFEATLEVAAGTKVTWVNQDGMFHTVTDADGAFDSGEIQPNKRWSRTFDEPGVYEIYCKPHAYQQDGIWKGMVMTLTVT